MSPLLGKGSAESLTLPIPSARFRARSIFEFWPRGLFYLPLIVQWLLLSLRHGHGALPTLVNPRFECGGLCGESKTQIFAEFGAAAQRYLAPFVAFRRASTAGPRSVERDLARALTLMKSEGLSFPLIAKPDIGCNGAGVQLIADAAELRHYIASFPTGEKLLLQLWVDDPGEAGIFYVRDPEAERGSIFSITLKYFPYVVGDGVSTVEQLVRADARAGRIADVYLSRFGDQQHRVLARGEPFRLVLTGNHCKGAIFRDGTYLATPALTAQFETIARSIPEFHFGRFDVRFTSLAELQRGNFRIIEVNGAGSEATHVWDPDMGLFDAYRVLFRQINMAFSIGAKLRTRGLQPISLLTLLRFYLRQRRLMAAYPLSH